MGKSFAFVMEQDEALKKIRYELNEASIKTRREAPVQYGIKFLCDDGATFILYFSKGKSSKIYFEKETQEVVTCVENFVVQLKNHPKENLYRFMQAIKYLKTSKSLSGKICWVPLL